MALMRLIQGVGYVLDSQYNSTINAFYGGLPQRMSARIVLYPQSAGVQNQQQQLIQQQQAQQYLAQQQQAQQQALIQQYLAQQQQAQQQIPSTNQQLLAIAGQLAGTPQGQQLINQLGGLAGNVIGQVGGAATNLLSSLIGGLSGGIGAAGSAIGNLFNPTPTPSTPYAGIGPQPFTPPTSWQNQSWQQNPSYDLSNILQMFPSSGQGSASLPPVPPAGGGFFDSSMLA